MEYIRSKAGVGVGRKEGRKGFFGFLPIQCLNGKSSFFIKNHNSFPNHKGPVLSIKISLFTAFCWVARLTFRSNVYWLKSLIDCLFSFRSKSQDYETVPILRILESKDLHKMIPAFGCLYVIACSSALLEVFTEAIQIVVRLAKSEWKILLKQISYESRESGSPVLAVFVAGSLVAILAFTCPLQNMTYVIAGSQLTAGVLRASYFLYAPFRPKSINPKRELRDFDCRWPNANKDLFVHRRLIAGLQPVGYRKQIREAVSAQAY